MITLLLAKVIGLYMLVLGIALIMRHKEIREAEQHFKEEGLLRFVLALLIVIGGLFFVTSYSDFSSVTAGIITLFGWLLLLKGLVLLFLSGSSLNALVKTFNHKNWYIGGGAVLIGIGAYLACVGFGYQW